MNIFYVEKVKVDEEEGFEEFVVLNAVGELEKKISMGDTSPNLAKNPNEMTEAEINALYGLDDVEDSVDSSSKEDDNGFDIEQYY
jgi:hypothetical protein